MPIRLAINGALGRMGRRLTALASADPRFTIAALLEAPGHPGLGTDPEGAGVAAVGALPDGVDVCVDFSVPAATRARVDECGRRRVAMVVGTTGLSAADLTLLERAAATIPILHARNMSAGIAALALTLPELIRRLGPGTCAEIVEIHHERKADAPSGTALALGEAVAAALGGTLDDAVYGRRGAIGARRPSELGIHAVRGGDEPGVHTVYLFNGSERIEVTHRALSRDVFAAGALRAAAFVAGRSPGLYGIADVVRAGVADAVGPPPTSA